MLARTTGRAAAVLLVAEGLGILALLVWQIGALLAGDTAVLTTAIALAVLTAIGAAAVLAFGVATWRERSWGRSGGVVTQLLILAVALGAITGAFAAPGIALALAAPAVVTLVLLAMTVRASAPPREDRAGGDA